MQNASAAILLIALLPASLLAKEDADVVAVWADGPPAWQAPTEPERDTTGPDGRTVAGRRVTRLGNVSKPELHIYKPESGNSDTVVVICPGGGYSILAWDLEGSEVASWLTDLGICAAVLKYRVPTRQADQPWLAPVQDIQRSISLIRSGAIDGIQAKSVGVLGFSAGGNAAARSATSAQRHYEARDETDQSSFTPDFAVLIYPAWLMKKDQPSETIDEIEVTKETPPMFFAHAADDRVSCMSSVALFAALKQMDVDASLHVFASGGHGFGAREAGEPTDAWPSLCETWMRTQGWLD